MRKATEWVKMAFAAVLVNAFHAALKDRKEAFESFGVDFTANVFSGYVAGEIIAR